MISKQRAIFWIIAAVLAPLLFSILFANGYMALWYMKTAQRAPPPIDVVQRCVMRASGFSLWLSVGLL